jgi:vancomycin resistance protein VanW
MYKGTAKPKHRGKLRLRLGKAFYTFKRYFEWAQNRRDFAARRGTDTLAFAVAEHETQLLRQLRDVDMQLQRNKITNLRLAVERLDGLLLYPGEVFSYWRLIGKPTARRGFLAGMQLQNGTVTSATGGGLCQLSNLLFWLTLHTPLSVTERHRHGYDVFPDSNRTLPFGSGATCFYNYGDLRFKNETDSVYRLSLAVLEHTLRGEWQCETAPEYKYEVYQKEHFMQLEFWGGYTRHNVLCRRVFAADGGLLADEFIVENHAVMMYEPLLTN